MKTIWQQSYSVWGQGLPVSAIVAALPIAVLLFLLAVKRKPAWLAALYGLATTLVIALVAYRMPVELALSSAAYGAAFGLFPICWIVFWAIVLYNLTVKTGKFAIIKHSIGSLTSDLRLQAIIIAFGFGAFIEGTAGFGTPVAVAGAMMVGLGFTPFYAAALCLLANTAPVAFGSIGLPLITLAGVTGLPLDKLSATVGKLCSPIALILPAYMILTMGGLNSALEIWPALLLAGVTFAGVQFLVSNYIGVQLTVILSSIASMGALVLLLRVWQPRPRGAREASPRSNRKNSNPKNANPREPGPFDLAVPLAPEAPPDRNDKRSYTLKETLDGWMPYIFLVIMVLLWGFRPLQATLNTASFPIAWPGLHLLVLRTPPVVASASRYPAIFNLTLLSASGTSCMFATILAAIFLRIGFLDFAKIVVESAYQLRFPILAIAAVLSMAFVMNYCGATGTLALAFAATGAAFPFFSSFLGWLGVFLTGSDTSANALFGSLQVITARKLAFNPVLIAAANSSGGVMGKMISVQSIAVAAAATGITVRQQAKLLRFTLKHSLLLATLVGLEVLAYAYAAR